MLPFKERETTVCPILSRRIGRIRRIRGKSMMVVVVDSFLWMQEMRVEIVQGAVTLEALLIVRNPAYLCAGVDPTISVWCLAYIKSGGTDTKRSQIYEDRSLALQRMQEYL